MTPEQELKLNELYDFMQNLKRSSHVPREVDQSFRERFKDLLKTFTPYLTSEIQPSDKEQVTSGGGGETVPLPFTGLKKVLDPDTNSFIYLAYYQ